MFWWKKIKHLEEEIASIRNELFEIKWEAKNKTSDVDRKLDRLANYLGVVERTIHKTEFVKKGGSEKE